MVKLGVMMAEKLEDLMLQVGPYIPFAASFTVRRGINKLGQSVLNLGCGHGKSMRQVSKHHGSRFTVGADIYQPYLKLCKKQRIHDEHVLCDIRKLPFKRKSFDIVLCMQVLEHLEKKDGENLIEAMEQVARRQVIISTPVGKFKRPAHENNPYQEHRSSWFPNDLRRRGYSVRGQGFRGTLELLYHLHRIVYSLSSILWIPISPVFHFFPELAGNMVCIKEFKH